MTHERYTHGHHRAVLASHSGRTAASSAAYLIPRLAAGQSVLDIGCGPGTITADLARAVAPGPVLGVDRSEQAIATAEPRAHSIEHLSFATADVYDLQMADGSFDVVHAHQVLQHLADPVAALAEMRRVCRPGGIVAVRDADYSSFAWAPLDRRLDRWLALYRDLARDNGGEPDAGRFLHRWMIDAGFTEVHSGASTWCFSTPADRVWWSSTWAERLRESNIAQQLLDSGRATPDDLDQLASAFLEWADDPAAWFSVPHGEAIGWA